MQFLVNGSVLCKLQDASPNARRLCRSLTSSTGTRGQILPQLQSHVQDLASLDFETIPKDQRYQTAANVCLAVEAVCRFYNPDSATYTATFIGQFPQFAALFYALILNTLCICTCDDDRSFCSATSRIILSTLSNLLSNEAGLKLFALSPTLLQNLQLIITTWATFAAGKVAAVSDTTTVAIINTLFEYQPTRQALEYGTSSIPKAQLCGAVGRLLETASCLYDPSFPLPSSTFTNVRGLGLIGQIRPSLRRDFFRSGVIECLCDILKRLVIDDPQTSRSWETQKYTTHEKAVVVAQELYLLLKDDASTTWPINALDCGLLEIIVHAVACFGTNRLLPCGPMPLLLKYIADWCLRSKRVAVRLHDVLDGVRNDQVLWNSLPPASSSVHPLTAGWYTFLDTLRDTMTVMPVTGSLVINCMNENPPLVTPSAISAVLHVKTLWYAPANASDRKDGHHGSQACHER
ncbi:hypothetical protein BDZ89DRAFT_1141913 [Hymenopellis radicata]|nr:hypothetical protein BDZ89DRAFT_1141913 [Hymenopellis radicata]